MRLLRYDEVVFYCPKSDAFSDSEQVVDFSIADRCGGLKVVRRIVLHHAWVGWLWQGEYLPRGEVVGKADAVRLRDVEGSLHIAAVLQGDVEERLTGCNGDNHSMW